MVLHGGPDAEGVARWDFSTNANACGPAPMALLDVDPSCYPDPSSTALKAALAAHHGVDPQRIVIAASASEFIARASTAVALRLPGAGVFAPRPGYGDYRAAAQARGLREVALEAAQLVWQTSPDSPLGRTVAVLPAAGALHVVDCAYAPLRLDVPERDPFGLSLSKAGALGHQPFDTGLRQAQSLLRANGVKANGDAWQLWSPNKALGLTGVRGAYAIAPPDDPWQASIEALAPSWPLGAHGVAMLTAWTRPATQHWLQDSLATLTRWKARQLELCASLGWSCEDSETPFHVARGPGLVERLPALRRHGIKLRDTASMGLPGAVRLGVQPPAAQDALARAWMEVTR